MNIDFPEPVLAQPETHDRVYLECGEHRLELPFQHDILKVGQELFVHGTPASEWGKEVYEGVYTIVRIERWSDNNA